MANTKCEFDLLQRVTVPDGSNIVGVVVTRMESADVSPMYTLAWIGFNGRSQSGAFSEAEVIQFNPKQWPVSTDETAARNRKPARKSKSKSKRK